MLQQRTSAARRFGHSHSQKALWSRLKNCRAGRGDILKKCFGGSLMQAKPLSLAQSLPKQSSERGAPDGHGYGIKHSWVSSIITSDTEHPVCISATRRMLAACLVLDLVTGCSGFPTLGHKSG